MYLKGKRYLSQFNAEDSARAEQIQKLFPELGDRNGRFGSALIQEVTIEVGYWRKANAIHGWFVREVQAGEDDCGSYYLSRARLGELQDLCQRVLDFKHLANELLPNTQGFFFGSQDYDEYYYQDIEHTLEIIERAMSLPDSWDLEYRSSW
jgi:hypothetical protein